MTVRAVGPTDDLQRAIADARGGDEIVLKPSSTGAMYLAPADFTAYTLPDKGSGTLPITIRSEAPTPADGKRVSIADRPNMPKLVTRVGSPGFFDNLNRSHHYRLSNLWFTNQRRADGSGTSYLLGGGADNINHDVANFPNNIEIDHCFFNPLEWDEESGNNLYASVNYAVETAGRNIVIRDSYMTGFGCRYANDRVTLLDSGGVLIGTAPGPYTIDNCYIDAWFVGFFLGGGDPGSANRATVQASSFTSMTLSQAANLAAGDYISFRVDPNHPMNPGGDTWGCAIVQSVSGNTITFPETWISGGGAHQDNKIKGPPPLVGGEARWRGWIPSDIRVTRTDFYKPKRWYDLNGSDGKGFFEIKLGDRVLIDGCTFDGRTGCTITVRNQGGAAAWSVIRNLTMSNCLFKQFSVLFATLFDDNQRLSMPSSNIKFDNILAYGDVGPDPNFNIRPKVFIGQHGDGIEFNHITALQSGEILRSGSGSGFALREQMTNFKWTNCITNWGTGEQHGFMCLNSTDGKFTPCAPNAVWTKSVMIGAPKGPFTDGRRSLADFPAGNFNPPTMEDVGFVNPATGDYGLRSDSPYRGMGTDGKDIGVDMVQLKAHLSGEVIAPSPQPTPIPIPPTPIPQPPPPTPEPPPPTEPPTTPPTGTVRVVGRALQGEQSVVGVKVSLAGMETVSREGDALFWFDTLVPVGSIITGSKEGWTFEPVTVKEGVPLFGLQGIPVTPPPPQPTPDPIPVPDPEPPPPTPVPPKPCSITAPVSVSVRRNSTGIIPVTLTDLTGSVVVKVLGSDGQVTVSPLTWTASATSSVKQFQVKVKKQSRTITFESPCGAAVVKVNVT